MDTDTTVVVFRMWRNPGTNGSEPIALFPLEDAGNGMCESYERVGQHGPADYASVIARTRPAWPDEYAPLQRELERAPYRYKLDIRKRSPKL